MVESSWSDSQSTITATELGSAVDLTATPRPRCVVPKVRITRQRNGSDDQQVPEYWDQTVPVWSSCKEARSRTKRKLKGDSVCRHGQNSRRFGDGRDAGGATMVVRDAAAPAAVKRCYSEDEREYSAGETPAATASEVQVTVAMLISPASPVLGTSRCSGGTTKHRCEACNQLWRGSPVALATTLGGHVALRIAA